MFLFVKFIQQLGFNHASRSLTHLPKCREPYLGSYGNGHEFRFVLMWWQSLNAPLRNMMATYQICYSITEIRKITRMLALLMQGGDRNEAFRWVEAAFGGMYRWRWMCGFFTGEEKQNMYWDKHIKSKLVNRCFIFFFNNLMWRKNSTSTIAPLVVRIGISSWKPLVNLSAWSFPHHHQTRLF